ncbi:MAG: enoyl-CoA hydratase/isomerase family protein [Proteobacteria bacterium]|jgi:enoyl-CoA hydratase|nr:enoyl-CoA hydratase/isomerase family protein [Pseudomonadota bacterium]MDA1299677.1 enoyl-CoA hydratase/isomerase family protein [Pseudomonadota bacterium]
MKLDNVIYEVSENIARITMNRGDKMNALNHGLWDDLIAAFDEAEHDPEVRAIILCGKGRAFCAGWDLKASYYITGPQDQQQWTTSNALSALRSISERYLKIMNIPKPVVAQVHGYCLAAGCYLEMLCDMAIAAEDARMGHPVGRGGVDSMPLWVSYLGQRKAREMLMTQKIIDGKEAERIGLVNYAVPADKLEQEVWATAKTLAAADPDAIAIQKTAFNTHAEIMGRGATFAYHSQLNALGRVGAGGRGRGGISIDESRANTKAQQPD